MKNFYLFVDGTTLYFGVKNEISNIYFSISPTDFKIIDNPPQPPHDFAKIFDYINAIFDSAEKTDYQKPEKYFELELNSLKNIFRKEEKESFKYYNYETYSKCVLTCGRVNLHFIDYTESPEIMKNYTIEINFYKPGIIDPNFKIYFVIDLRKITFYCRNIPYKTADFGEVFFYRKGKSLLFNVNYFSLAKKNFEELKRKIILTNL